MKLPATTGCQATTGCIATTNCSALVAQQLLVALQIPVGWHWLVGTGCSETTGHQLPGEHFMLGLWAVLSELSVL